MPSGITEPVATGKLTSGKDFVLRCARQFGALMYMRDDSLDTSIKLPEADTQFYDKQLTEVKEKLHIFKNITLAEAAIVVEGNYQRALKSYKERLDEKAEIKNRYITMMEKIEAWEPPTTEHENLKDYAIQQLNDSIDWDCDTQYLTKPERESPQEWLDTMIRHYESNISYYEKRKQEEIERVAENNKWVTDLIASLKEVD